MEDGREKQRGTRVSALQIRSAMRDEMRNQNAQLSQLTVVTDHGQERERERVRIPERDPGRNPKWSETRRWRRASSPKGVEKKEAAAGFGGMRDSSPTFRNSA